MSGPLKGKAFVLYVKEKDQREKYKNTITDLGGEVAGRLTPKVQYAIFDGGSKDQWTNCVSSSVKLVHPGWLSKVKKEQAWVSTKDHKAVPPKSLQADTKKGGNESPKKDDAKVAKKIAKEDEDTTDDEAVPKQAKVKEGKEKAKEAEKEKRSRSKAKAKETKEAPEKPTKGTTKAAAKEPETPEKYTKTDNKRKRAESTTEEKTPTKRQKTPTKGGKKEETPPKAPKTTKPSPKKPVEKETAEETPKKRKRTTSKSTEEPKRAKQKVLPSRVIVLSGVEEDERAELEVALKKLGNNTLQPNITAATTHVVIGSNNRTKKALQGLATGLWLVKSQWVTKSLAEKKWLDEDKFEAVDWFPGCKKSRAARTTPEKLLLQGKRVHVGPSQLGMAKDVLEKFVTDNGGKIHSQPVGSHYAIAGKRPPLIERKEDEEEPVSIVTADWLLDSLTNYTTLSPSKYKVEIAERVKKTPTPKKRNPKGVSKAPAAKKSTNKEEKPTVKNQGGKAAAAKKAVPEKKEIAAESKKKTKEPSEEEDFEEEKKVTAPPTLVSQELDVDSDEDKPVLNLSKSDLAEDDDGSLSD